VNALPPAVRGLLQLLSGTALEPPLTESEHRSLLELAERTHCALFWTTDQVRLARNAERRRRLWLAYDEAATALSDRGLEFVVLKGFTHGADFGIDPARRYQSDLDFLCQPEDIARAQAALEQLGYRPQGSEELSDDHLRPLVKPFTWQWRGDYFDPDLPISIELHNTLWSSAHDRIQIPDIHHFWNRRATLLVDGRTVPALAATDRIAFAALHVLRHILRNDASPAHTFELASALTESADDDAFWQAWKQIHDAEFRALQAVAFQFAREWFGYKLSPVAEQECRALPEPVHAWFRSYAYSPLINLVQPNKDAVWLHMALLPGGIDRVMVALRKLAPMRLPAGKFWSRVRYHALALARTLLTSSRRRGPTAPSTASHTSD